MNFQNYYSMIFSFFKPQRINKRFRKSRNKLKKKNIEEENNLEEALKEHSKNLEEFSSIINLKDIIKKSDYTFNLSMKSLKRKINFKYFYIKFTIPKDKNKTEKK